MKVTCHPPRLGGTSRMGGGGIRNQIRRILICYEMLFAELSSENFVLGVSVSTLDAEVELDLRLCT